tara:strand:+ start:10843 stop:11223 length:381 start_codon:yes stop_codon:yes gene_type:complete
MYNIEMNILIKLGVQQSDLDNILSTCFEGGSNYWINKVQVVGNDYKGCRYSSDVVSQGGKLIIITHDDEGLMLTKNKLVKGIQKWYEKIHYPRHKEIQDEFHLFDWDADDSDFILQYALFDKIVYG